MPRLIVPALWYGAILLGSSLPASTFEPIPAVAGLSYLAHAVLYGVLGAALLLGAGDELLQSTVPGRHSSVVDLVVDVAAATLVATVAERRRRRGGPPDR